MKPCFSHQKAPCLNVRPRRGIHRHFFEALNAESFVQTRPPLQGSPDARLFDRPRNGLRNLLSGFSQRNNFEGESTTGISLPTGGCTMAIRTDFPGNTAGNAQSSHSEPELS